MRRIICSLSLSLTLALALAVRAHPEAQSLAARAEKAPARSDLVTPTPTQDLFLISGKLTNAVPLVEGPNDKNIARVTTTIFENAHYLRQPLDKEKASKFLDRYLDSLDNLHIYFLQSDLKQFEEYRG